MNKTEFLSSFQNVLQTETILSDDTCLFDLEEWDSLAMITTIAFIDKNFGLKISIKDVQDFTMVSDIVKYLGL